MIAAGTLKPEINEEAGILSLILIQLAKLTRLMEKHTGEIISDDEVISPDE